VLIDDCEEVLRTLDRTVDSFFSFLYVSSITAVNSSMTSCIRSGVLARVNSTGFMMRSRAVTEMLTSFLRRNLLAADKEMRQESVIVRC
jgi:hypothetical protein